MDFKTLRNIYLDKYQTAIEHLDAMEDYVRSKELTANLSLEQPPKAKVGLCDQFDSMLATLREQYLTKILKTKGGLYYFEQFAQTPGAAALDFAKFIQETQGDEQTAQEDIDDVQIETATDRKKYDHSNHPKLKRARDLSPRRYQLTLKAFRKYGDGLILDKLLTCTNDEEAAEYLAALNGYTT